MPRDAATKSCLFDAWSRLSLYILCKHCLPSARHPELCIDSAMTLDLVDGHATWQCQSNAKETITVKTSKQKISPRVFTNILGARCYTRSCKAGQVPSSRAVESNPSVRASAPGPVPRHSAPSGHCDHFVSSRGCLQRRMNIHS